MQKHEIEGKPITPADAAAVKSERMRQGEGVGKGSLPARMQARSRGTLTDQQVHATQ